MAQDQGDGVIKPAVSLSAYYGPRSAQNSLKLSMPVTPEEEEFFSQFEELRIVPNFTMAEPMFGIEKQYGPFMANQPASVPMWMAIALSRRKRCRLLPPPWLEEEHLKEVLSQERSNPQMFQPLPFYYVEIAKALFTHKPVETFGGNQRFSKVRLLLESLRKVRHYKIEMGLRKLNGPMTVRLNNLAAAECNMIRLLFKGTLDHYWETSKNNRAILEASMLAGGTQSIRYTPGGTAGGSVAGPAGGF